MHDPYDPNTTIADHAHGIARAESAITRLAALRRDRWYPQFHIASAGGWINDPNGLSWFDGRWHVFYQLHPFSTSWGPMHWGHVSSADMLSWHREPTAFAPSILADRDGVYSGSAVTGDDGKLYVFYTGHRWANGVDEAEGNLEVQCLAVSDDGIHFNKLGAVVDNPARLFHFRDPKVWRQDGTWYMIVGRRSPDRRGEIVWYTSANMLDWTYGGVLYRHPDPQVFMLECPDFYPLAAPDGHVSWVLCYSAMSRRDSGLANKNIAGYVIGTWRPGEAFCPRTAFRPWDEGPNFYAPQSMLAPDGRRLMYGWMSPLSSASLKDDGWCGQLTLPREIILDVDGSIRCRPAAELASLRDTTHEFGPLELAANEQRELLADAGALEIELTVDLGRTSAERAGIKVHATPDGGFTYIAYDAQRGLVVVDRMATSSGEHGYRAARLDPDELRAATLELRAFIDRGSVEVFVNGGRHAISAYSLPAEGQRAVKLLAENGALSVPCARTHRLRSIGLA